MLCFYLVYGYIWEEKNKIVVNFRCKYDMLVKMVCWFNYGDCFMVLVVGRKGRLGWDLRFVCVN